MKVTRNTICVKNIFTNAFKPKWNGQNGRLNSKISSALREDAADHKSYWYLYSDPATYEYEAQVHSLTAITPFDLILKTSP